MPFMPLTLETLKDLDMGRVSVAFQLELQRIVLDCIDRPGDKNPRKVTIEMKVTPIVDDTGSCEGASGEFSVKSSVPQRKSKPYHFRANKKGALVFSEESPDNADQTTFGDMDSEGRVRRRKPE